MKTEPDAAKRAAAAEMWQFYTAFIDEGFSDKQALEILANILSEAMRNNKDD